MNNNNDNSDNSESNEGNNASSNISVASKVYDHIMSAFPVQLGKATSKRERCERQLGKDSNLVYGEITFEGFGIVFQKIKEVYGRPNQGASGPNGVLQSRGGKFYDLGSGTGKPVIAAAVLHNFDLCCGIEILEGLYSVSLEAVESYNTRGKIHPLLSNREIPTQCKVVRGNFLDVQFFDWRDGDVVFANSTCYDEARLDQIAQLAKGMKKGSFFISLTRRLPIGDFEVVECNIYPMSWGDASIFIMQKVTHPDNSNNSSSPKPEA